MAYAHRTQYRVTVYRTWSYSRYVSHATVCVVQHWSSMFYCYVTT